MQRFEARKKAVRAGLGLLSALSLSYICWAPAQAEQNPGWGDAGPSMSSSSPLSSTSSPAPASVPASGPSTTPASAPALTPASVPALTPALRPALSAGSSHNTGMVSASSIRKDRGTAVRMAGYRWLDKMAMADPGLVAAICTYSSAAKVLAGHPHLDKIAEADHYTCRRITKFKSAARTLVANPKALRVVSLDPEGIYRAIKNDRSIARRLTKNNYFDQMIVENPDLGKFLANYM
jgi:hypothetical protein